jgi:hypothetical protein
MYAKGGVPAGTSRSIARTGYNNTGLTVTKATPVRLTPTGVIAIDVASESSANAIAGLIKADIANANVGDIVNSGIIEDIITSAIVGDIMYVSKSGGLTNLKPSIGVNSFNAGDWVIRVGVIAQNNDNPSLLDILVNIQIIGEL